MHRKMNFNFKKDSYFVNHFITKYNNYCWQYFYEDTLLKDFPSQFYNHHFFVKKSNSRGKVQDRILVLSNKFIYNLVLLSKKDSLKIEKVKWSDAIISISQVLVNPTDCLELRVYCTEKINKDENKKEGMKTLKHKSEREFIFQEKRDKELFLFTLRKNYYNLTRKYLNVEVDSAKFESKISKK